MSRTLKIVNGQLDFDRSSGQINLVSGGRKASQDMAESLLQDYLAEIDYGSYLKQVVSNPIPYAGELFVRYYISEAIEKLQAKQAQDPSLTSGEKITDILELELEDDGEGTLVFFVRVATADGGATETAGGKATQLDHQYERF